ncbi:hypothetical protein [Paenibacillus shenyangensis]|uniref:hypothetical protein n=1 Tax=Paenibacillus sp. A9 TaxID=1284352 RepID=UPI00037B7E26|nr:hypothetical protein [Paenibacillus sp. A9]
MDIIPYYLTERDESTGELVITSPVGLPTPAEIRSRWTYGLSLANAAGVTMDDRDILGFLMTAVKETERRLGILLKSTIIACNPDDRGLIQGVDYELEEQPYDYDMQKWQSYGFIQLRQRYASQINAFRLVNYAGQLTVNFMDYPEWIKLNKKASHLQIVNRGGNGMTAGMGYGMGYNSTPFAAGLLSRTPQVFHIDYVAGLSPAQLTEDIRAVVAKMAAVDVLGVAGDSTLAGMAGYSLSIDGISESFQSTASAMYGTYSAHIVQLQSEVSAFFDPKIGGGRTKMRGFTMGGL